MKTEVSFKTIDYSNQCALNGELRQCCCNCTHHLLVNKACGYFEKHDSCLCNESLGFYVCDLFSNEDYSVRFIGEHSVGCENYSPRAKEG